MGDTLEHAVSRLKKYLNRRYRDRQADKHELHAYDVGTRSEVSLRAEDIERVIAYIEAVRK